MPTVQSIHAFLKTLAPEELSYDWDHVGLLCGRADREVRRVLVALDPFLPVAEEAAVLDCQLVLTHHPAVWKLDAVNDASMAGCALLFLIEHGISALNAHTNLDRVKGGVNDCLAKQIGLHNIQIPFPDGLATDGRAYGLLRGGEIAPLAPADFAAHVKKALGCAGLRYADGGRTISRVAVGGGSCGDELHHAAQAGFDALVTADCKYNQFVDAAALGVTLIDAGHFQTENPVCTMLADALRTEFPKLTVYLSKIHRDCIIFA